MAASSLSNFDTVPSNDRWSDGRMDGVTVARPMLRACKNGLVHLLENVREGVGRDAVHNCGNW